MRNIIALFIIAILFLTATAVYAAEIESVSVSSTTNTVSNARPEEPQWVQYNPAKHGVWQWQRGNAKNGYQGHWLKTPANYKGGVLVWPNGAMEMAKCGNELPSPPVPPKVIIREVIKEVPVVRTEVKWRTRTITKTVPAPAPPPTVNNYYSFSNSTTMAAQLGGALAPTISSTSLMGVGWQRVQDVNICVSNGNDINITNNNANTNTNANNNAINVGDGSATGTATGTGTSTAGGN